MGRVLRGEIRQRALRKITTYFQREHAEDNEAPVAAAGGPIAGEGAVAAAGGAALWLPLRPT